MLIFLSIIRIYALCLDDFLEIVNNPDTLSISLSLNFSSEEIFKKYKDNIDGLLKDLLALDETKLENSIDLVNFLIQKGIRIPLELLIKVPIPIDDEIIDFYIYKEDGYQKFFDTITKYSGEVKLVRGMIKYNSNNKTVAFIEGSIANMSIPLIEVLRNRGLLGRTHDDETEDNFMNLAMDIPLDFTPKYQIYRAMQILKMAMLNDPEMQVPIELVTILAIEEEADKYRLNY